MMLCQLRTMCQQLLDVPTRFRPVAPARRPSLLGISPHQQLACLRDHLIVVSFLRIHPYPDQYPLVRACFREQRLMAGKVIRGQSHG